MNWVIINGLIRYQVGQCELTVSHCELFTKSDDFAAKTSHAKAGRIEIV